MLVLDSHLEIFLPFYHRLVNLSPTSTSNPTMVNCLDFKKLLGAKQRNNWKHWGCYWDITELDNWVNISFFFFKKKSFPTALNKADANGIFQRTRTNNFTICMEIQKTLNSQRNLEKEEWNWRNQPAWLQALWQSHSHQDSMVLAQRQKHRLMEQNRKPRDKYTNLWTPYFQQRRQGYTMEKRQPL